MFPVLTVLIMDWSYIPSAGAYPVVGCTVEAVLGIIKLDGVVVVLTVGTFQGAMREINEPDSAVAFLRIVINELSYIVVDILHNY